jgi:DNA invertase Pin-like site-specific DNA recombinase
VVVAEKIDRISRLPCQRPRLVAAIRAKGARLAVPGIVDLSELAASAEGVSRIVLESIQDMLLRLALQMARDDYEDRRERQRQGIELAKSAGKYKGRRADPTTAVGDRPARRRPEHRQDGQAARCSTAQVKRIWAPTRRVPPKSNEPLTQGDVMKKDACGTRRCDRGRVRRTVARKPRWTGPRSSRRCQAR